MQNAYIKKLIYYEFQSFIFIWLIQKKLLKLAIIFLLLEDKSVSNNNSSNLKL